MLKEDRILGERASHTLNDTYKQHRAAFHRWLEAKVSGGKIESRTANDYKAGVKSLLTEYTINKPSDCDAIDFGDKQSRGLRNFFNYLEDEEIQKIAGYSLSTWRRKVQIKKSGKDRTFPTSEEMIEAWKHLKDNETTIFKLLAYSGCRFSHGYNVLKKANLLKFEIKGDIAYINTESLTKHTKQSFVMFFPASFVKELQNFNPSTLGNPTSLKRNLQHGNVSAKTIRKWHFNLMRKRARIDSAVANFLHGRGQSNVGDDVYLEQLGFALEEYPKVLKLIPDFDSIPRLELPNPTKTNPDSLNAVWFSHDEEFKQWLIRHKIGLIRRKNGSVYVSQHGTLNNYFKNHTVMSPNEITKEKNRKFIFAFNNFIEFISEGKGIKPFGLGRHEWSEIVNYSGIRAQEKAYA